ncbi:MAG: hypothetical protein Q8P49_03450 [Candidatus Liptonbacteria bacterium]|nr:hypothetical protein [Candidatus Liptonbacteria bacterium]
MNFDFNELEQLGSGAEKRVYAHPDNPEKVIGAFRKGLEENPNETKARFYFNKILHILLPNNTADVHMASSKIFFAERKRLIGRIKTEESGGSDKDYDQDYYDLCKKLENIGVQYDGADVNFQYDDSGNLIYVENQRPWRSWLRNGKISPYFDREKLFAAIQGLEPRSKERALVYLERLDGFLEEEKKYRSQDKK